MKRLILMVVTAATFISCGDHFLGPTDSKELLVFFTVHPSSYSSPWIGHIVSTTKNGADMATLSNDSSFIYCAPANGKMAYATHNISETVIVANVDGSNAIDITLPSSSTRAVAPNSVVLSPDGATVSYATQDASLNDTWIWFANTDGTNRRYVRIDGLTKATPQFSPNGRFLALIASDPSYLSGFAGQLYVIDIAQMTSVRVADSAQHTENSALAWSPNGERIAFIKFGGDPKGAVLSSRISVVDLADHHVVDLTPEVSYAAGQALPYAGISWSPDGKRLAYCFTAGGAGNGNGLYDLWTISLDSNIQTNITNTSNFYEYSPHWSPDGKELLFLAIDSKSNGSLKRINPDSRIETVIYSGGQVSGLYPGEGFWERP